MRFRTVVAQAPATLASHASLFTSRWPQHHGASFAARRALPDSELTLAEILAARGWRTAAITAGGQMLRRTGVAQGFETFRVQWERADAGAFEKKIDRALRVLESPDPRPLFLFLHTYEIHLPYTPKPALLERLDPGYEGAFRRAVDLGTIRTLNETGGSLSERDARRVRAAHDAELMSVDDAFGRLARELARRRRPSILVVTSDHGEELGEHGRMAWHGHTLFDELLLVPWLMKLPGGEGAGLAIDLPVRGIDVAPTLLDLLGLPPPAEFQGRSLAPLVRGGRLEELPALFQRSRFEEAETSIEGIRWRGWKLHAGRLFDLRNDPAERVDRSLEAAATRTELERRMAETLASGAPAAAAGLELDAEAAEQLRALGYLR